MSAIEHVFVLMLENRSFDHMLGFSGITGTDAETGRPTRINGLAGESNSFRGVSYEVSQPAADRMPLDPGHEFPDVVEQLCGEAVTFVPHHAYPPIDNSGFAANFGELSLKNAKMQPTPSPGQIMQCFDPGQLPVLTTLAMEFAVCDSWFCSMPGPTWPNRFFALGGSSAGLDHSPTGAETGIWQTIRGFTFQNGSIFDQPIRWRIYSGHPLITFAHALRGIHITSIRDYSSFVTDIADTAYDTQFTWIEPDFGHVLSDFVGGNSEHPLDGVMGGEALIKRTYEALRRSPLWASSMLIVTWDEHGGFYDHVPPPAAIPPGDTPQFRSANQEGFDFDRYGPRVPAIVVSPFIPRNVIDHRLYDHASIPATLKSLFNLKSMTARDAQANNLLTLATLTEPRVDAPEGVPDAEGTSRDLALSALDIELPPATRGDELIEQEQSNLPGFLYLAARAHFQISPWAQSVSTLLRRRQIRTRNDARDYLEEVRQALSARLPRREAVR
jgi:phospholipase C